MCMPKNDSAAIAAQQQEQVAQQERRRQKQVKKGQESIDQVFAQFDTPFYDKYKTDYVGAQQPELARQSDVAMGKTVASLADRGLDGSTIGASKMGAVQRTKTTAEGALANEATDAANKFRGNVEKQKGDLYALNQAAADPSMIAARATGEATALVPPSPSPLGDVFANTLNSINSYQKGNMYAPASSARPWWSLASGGGSGQVVR
jgi:hypothetical protein